MEDVYNEYRERLKQSKASSLELEIFETFVGTEFTENITDLIQALENKDYKKILNELKIISKNIFNIETNTYTRTERLGYTNLVDGYIFRVKSKIHREKDVKEELLEQAEQLLKQEKIDVKLAEKWIKKYKKYITENYRVSSRDYKLLISCIIHIDDIEVNYLTVEVNKLLLRTSIKLASELLKYY